MSLFDQYQRFSQDAMAINREAFIFTKHLMDKFPNHSPREIAHVIMIGVLDAETCQVLDLPHMTPPQPDTTCPNCQGEVELSEEKPDEIQCFHCGYAGPTRTPGTCGTCKDKHIATVIPRR